jgi:sulfur-carrier protein
MATVIVPPTLRKFAENQDEIVIAGTTVGEVLANLDQRYPGFRDRICDDTGNLRKFITIFAKMKDIRGQKQLNTPVGENDEIVIVPALAGG